MLGALVAVLAMSAVAASSAFASGKPIAETKAATSIYEYTATLHGVVNPNGAATKYYFEYGTTQIYGKKSAEVSAGSGTTNLEESLSGIELNPETTYHFRVVATNSNGTSDGEDATFKTIAKAKAGLPEFTPVGTAKFPLKFKGKIGGSSFKEEIVGDVWGYSTGTISGEIAGPKTLANVNIEFIHGNEGLGECSSVKNETGWSLVLSALSGRLGYINKEKHEVGLMVEPVKEPDARCSEHGLSEEYRGHLIGSMKGVNTASKKLELGWFSVGDEQDFPFFEGEKESGESFPLDLESGTNGRRKLGINAPNVESSLEKGEIEVKG